MQFLIDVQSGLMSVNGVPAAISMSGLPAGVTQVAFGDPGSGTVLSGGNWTGATSFSDPSPYQSYYNAWMTAMGMTLSQAQAAKIALVNSIYQVKRQAAVSVAVTAGTYNWDASDPAIPRMALMASMCFIDSLNTLVTKFNSLNSTLATYGSDVQGAFNNFVTILNNAAFNGTSYNWPGTGNAPIGGPTVGGNSSISPGASSVTAPTLKLIPVGGTAEVSLSPTDLMAIVTAINNQQINEQAVNLSKQAAINALTYVGAVISYDATTGW
jgi:hypothetical protein